MGTHKLSPVFKFQECKTQFQIQQFIAQYCFSRGIKCNIIHDDVLIEAQYSEEVQKVVENFIST